MVNKKEFEIICSLFRKNCGAANYKISQQKKADEEKGLRKSALTAFYEMHYEEATRGINPLTHEDENGLNRLVLDDDGKIVYDKKDALKMLKAIQLIQIQILD